MPRGGLDGRKAKRACVMTADESWQTGKIDEKGRGGCEKKAVLSERRQENAC